MCKINHQNKNDHYTYSYKYNYYLPGPGIFQSCCVICAGQTHWQRACCEWWADPGRGGCCVHASLLLDAPQPTLTSITDRRQPTLTSINHLYSEEKRRKVQAGFIPKMLPHGRLKHKIYKVHRQCLFIFYKYNALLKDKPATSTGHFFALGIENFFI